MEKNIYIKTLELGSESENGISYDSVIEKLNIDTIELTVSKIEKAQ